jgi:integrase
MRTHNGIEQRGPRTWRITVAGGRDPQTGRYLRVRETFYGSKTEAKNRRDELRVEVAQGTHVRADDPVGTYLLSWVEKRERLGRIRPKVAYTYRGYVRREIAPRIGRVRLDAVRPAHVQRVVDEGLASGLSPRSVTQVHRIMHAAFLDAVRLTVLRFNPCDGVTLPKAEKPQLRVPGALEVARLVEQMAPEHRAALALVAGTGVRRGEALAATWDAIALDGSSPRLHVRGTLQRSPAGLVVEAPKTARSARVVPLSESLVAILRRQRKEQAERRLIAGDAWNDGDYAFDRGDGRPVDPDAFGKAFRRARKAAGLEGVRLHDLRHGFASLLVTAETNARVVSDLLGHANVAFTLQTYLHPDEDAAMRAVAKAEELLGWGESGANGSRR